MEDIISDNTCLPKYRGRGLAAKMLVYILKDLQKEGFRMAVGVVHSENPPALKSVMLLDIYTPGFMKCQLSGVRCSNHAIHMCYNYREYIEQAMEYSGGRILSEEEMSKYADWTPY